VSPGERAPGSIPSRSPAATALLPRFLEHRRRDVVTIREALERADFETIGRIGHNMAGNGVSYGFPEMSAIGERLEAEANAGNAMAVLEQLASLEASLARTQ
jgi:HPt (histidine-containing phosphotransfer) domain-containing protein